MPAHCPALEIPPFTVAEVALALMLLAGAGLLFKSFAKLTAVEPGFRASQVLTLDISLPNSRYPNQKGVTFFSELQRRVRTLPSAATSRV